jgi:3-deoxy-D-manno-octulosonic-acid transferase
MLHLFSFLITILWPLIFALTWVATFFNPKIKKGFQLRKSSPWKKGAPTNEPPSKNPNTPSTIWFHVSSGEFEYAKTVITELKKRGHRIVVSYFSPSVEKSIANFKDVDEFFPSPWENHFSWRSFFKFHSPKVLAIARTDLWPVMIWQTKRRKIQDICFHILMICMMDIL